MTSLRRAAGVASFAVLGVLVVAGATGHADVLRVLRTPGLEPGVRRLSAGSPESAAASQAAQGWAARAQRWRSIPDYLNRPARDAAPKAGGHLRRTRDQLLRHTDLGSTAAGALAASAGPPDTIRVAFIRIEFQTDRGGTASTGDGRFDLSRPGSSVPPIDRPPRDRRFYQDHLEALHRFYDCQSYGRTVIVGDVWPRDDKGAYRCTDMADFGPWAFSHSDELYRAAVHLLRSMFFAADTQSTQLNDRIPWDQYDRFVMIHAGGDLQSDVLQDSPEDIPSFTVGVSDSDAIIFRDSTEWNRQHPIDKVAIVPETINQDGYLGALNGVIAHECGHLLFDFVDVYNTDTGLPVVGLWSLMDSGNLAGTTVRIPGQPDVFATGLLPPSIDPWQRQFCTDALKFPEASYGDTMTILNGERNPDMRRVSLSSDEYLLLENRWIAPFNLVELDQADSSRVILGPKNPDRFEYDALLPARKLPDDTYLPAAGILVWHIDESVMPLGEYAYPCDTARANYGCGFNSDQRHAIDVIEADALDDLGDLSSPDLLGEYRDPWYHSNNASLSDTTRPALRAHIGTLPHVRLDFLDEPDAAMHVAASRSWQLAGWPVRAPFPPGGPKLLAIDVNGDRLTDLCWAGGPEGDADSAAIFVLGGTGKGIIDTSAVFSRVLDRRPNPVMAAISLEGGVGNGPARLAVTTLPPGPKAGDPGGRVWLLDDRGAVVPGWPATLPSLATTPPVIAGVFRDTFVFVGCADGRVYALDLGGTVQAVSDPPLDGPIAGRLAVRTQFSPSEGPVVAAFYVAAGSERGQVAAFVHFPTAIPVGAASGAPAGARGPGPPPGPPVMLPASSAWPVRLGANGFSPDFLWIDFGGIGPAHGTDCFHGALSLVVHYADALWAYCLDGEPLPGWPGATGDTIAVGLAAGDPDGDGLPEVITQSVSSRVTYWDSDGHPSPGWPKRGTTETFRSASAPLAVDLARTGRSQPIAMNASGIVTALDIDGRESPGWPLATGLDAAGDPVLADIDGDHYLELVAPDAHGLLYAYSLPTRDSALVAPSWPMLGGDPERSSSLPFERTPVAPVAGSGPLIRGSLKAYPNPARRRPVQFAYSLTEPGEVEFHILDTSGHEVASFTRQARQTDNVEVWDPGALPSGLYMARLRFKGASSERVEVVPVGLLR